MPRAMKTKASARFPNPKPQRPKTHAEPCRLSVRVETTLAKVQTLSWRLSPETPRIQDPGNLISLKTDGLSCRKAVSQAKIADRQK